MNRIYIEKFNQTLYWIKDTLDNKPLGEIHIKDNKKTYQIKPQFQHQNIETEAKLCLRSSSAWHDYYKDFLWHFNHNITDTNTYKFPMFADACRLQHAEDDMFGRPTQLHPVASRAWNKMRDLAVLRGINLRIISAYRSLDYQKTIIQNKLSKGQTIKSILKVNALPGYSEHHTGCAIDIGSVGEAVLEERFDQSKAFSWLQDNAKRFGFYMSYPKNNTTGISYEPWHWCYKQEPKYED